MPLRSPSDALRTDMLISISRVRHLRLRSNHLFRSYIFYGGHFIIYRSPRGPDKRGDGRGRRYSARSPPTIRAPLPFFFSRLVGVLHPPFVGFLRGTRVGLYQTVVLFQPPTRPRLLFCLIWLRRPAGKGGGGLWRFWQLKRTPRMGRLDWLGSRKSNGPIIII